MLKINKNGRINLDSITVKLLIRIIIVTFFAGGASTFVALALIKLINSGRVQGIMIFLIWLLICIVISNTCIFLSVRRFTHVLQEMRTAVKEVENGNFDVKLDTDIKHMPEIKELYIEFNNMVSKLGNIETLRNDFIADVSHEFKTPIAAIEGYAMLMQDESLSENEKHEYINSIIYNSKRLSNLTGNILMISKLENDSVDIRREPFRLDEQIRRIVLTFEEQWSSKNLDIEVDLDTITYNGDEDMLYNVWLNLVSNAIKFSNQDGFLKIKLIDKKYSVIFTIEDSGIGMDEETVKRMNEKFFQGDKSRSSDGNGLGMTLVSKILDLCEAKLDIESEINKGTKFTVTLPVE